MLLALLVTLNFQVSPWQADSLDCRLESIHPSNLGSTKLYGALAGGSGVPSLLRWHQAVAGPDTFEVDDSQVWTYWVVVSNVWGQQLEPSCWPAITVGAPLGVGNPQGVPGEKWGWYDLSGRRLPAKPSRPGVYFRRDLGGVKRIVVL